jgi:nitrate/nitrite-specific signal transduction histidine kinase
LRTSNRSLELLYYTARRLSEVEPGEATYRALMTEIETLTGDGSITLCMIDPVTHQATQVFSTRPRPTALRFSVVAPIAMFARAMEQRIGSTPTARYFRFQSKIRSSSLES